MLKNRLQKRFRHLKKWALRTGVDAFRLYDRDIPEIPLVLDFFGDCSLLQEAENTDWAVSGALYKRPYEKDQAEEDQWLSAMKENIAEALYIPAERVFLKQRQKQRGASQYEKVSDTRFEKIVNEGGLLPGKLSFKVNLSDYLDTGLFVDRRLLRAIIRDEAAGKKVLNLFSYTGSFSVYAAAGGALSTDSVDLSNTYLNWARENFSLNGFSAEISQSSHGGAGTLREEKYLKTSRRGAEAQRSQSSDSITNCSPHKLIRADVLEFLEKAVAEKERWDIIIADPPAFSNSKNMIDNFDLKRDLSGLLCRCLELLAPDGKIFLSINLQRSAPAAAALEAELNMELQKQSRGSFSADISGKNCRITRVTDLGDKIIDEDFRGRKAPKTFEIKFYTSSFTDKPS